MRKEDCFFVGTIISKFSFKGELLVKPDTDDKFEEVDTEKDAESLLKHSLYLPLTLLPRLSGNKFYYHEVIGFEVFDVNYGYIGTISGINDASSQPIFEIHYQGKEILIPLHDDFLKEVNRKEKKIIVTTPDGLIDLYLEL